MDGHLVRLPDPAIPQRSLRSNTPVHSLPWRFPAAISKQRHQPVLLQLANIRAPLDSQQLHRVRRSNRHQLEDKPLDAGKRIGEERGQQPVASANLRVDLTNLPLTDTTGPISPATPTRAITW